jgi:ABC-type sugar transport system substrate-binding protein
MSKTILLVLTGDAGGEVDHYQVLQEKEAIREASAASLALEIIHATGFDHLRVIRKRLRDQAAPPIDAVIIEPSSVSATGLLLKQLKGETGFVLLNAWSADVQEAARDWGKGLPFGTVSTDHLGIGRIQGRQVRALVPQGASVLCVTGPPGSSAAAERLEGLREALGDQGSLYETAAGYWTESDGAAAFERWYRIYKKRALKVDAVVAQSDELAMGVRRAIEGLDDPEHREMLLRSPLLGVDACPDYGKMLVDTGRLTASVVTPATTGEAIRHLRDFWAHGKAMPLQALTPPAAYPPARPASVA